MKNDRDNILIATAISFLLLSGLFIMFGNLEKRFAYKRIKSCEAGIGYLQRQVEELEERLSEQNEALRGVEKDLQETDKDFRSHWHNRLKEKVVIPGKESK